jgi:hypothetical protein
MVISLMHLRARSASNLKVEDRASAHISRKAEKVLKTVRSSLIK